MHLLEISESKHQARFLLWSGQPLETTRRRQHARRAISQVATRSARREQRHDETRQGFRADEGYESGISSGNYRRSAITRLMQLQSREGARHKAGAFLTPLAAIDVEARHSQSVQAF